MLSVIFLVFFLMSNMMIFKQQQAYINHNTNREQIKANIFKSKRGKKKLYSLLDITIHLQKIHANIFSEHI